MVAKQPGTACAPHQQNQTGGDVDTSLTRSGEPIRGFKVNETTCINQDDPHRHRSFTAACYVFVCSEMNCWDPRCRPDAHLRIVRTGTHIIGNKEVLFLIPYSPCPYAILHFAPKIRKSAP